jgi:hypothetical protein
MIVAVIGGEYRPPLIATIYVRKRESFSGIKNGLFDFATHVAHIR